eukprot:TRINITY_DN3338_c0_g1_i9.p1 TRINITY_DN3338_c0_g1~~TRINITY_DN3338_c0_g1_i9.p1  ORF type:complete len:244 (-),score=89.08 TRINITY_DN3338_c0_g1_i9:101-832(-)
MKAVLFLALFVAAATCTNNVSILFEHFNLTHYHLANAIEARNNRNIFKFISSTVKAVSNWVVYEQDVEDTTPTLAEYFNDLGYETLPCYQNIQLFKATARAIYEKVKARRCSGLLTLAIELLTSIREANATCINAAQVIAKNIESNANPICKQQKEDFRRFGENFRNSTSTEIIRARGQITLEAFKIVIACAPRQSSKRVSLAEEEEKKKGPFRLIGRRWTLPVEGVFTIRKDGTVKREERKN